MISILRQIEESEQYALRFEALRKAYLKLTELLPRTALPANPGLAAQCRDSLTMAGANLGTEPPVKAIVDAGQTALEQIEDICRSNESAIEERDCELKEVVAIMAAAIGGFKGSGERQTSSLSRLADGFEALSRVADGPELRRQLRSEIDRLRVSVEEIRRQGEESLRNFELQVSSFRQRLEMARKESGNDRLTRLGSRREAERHLHRIPGRNCRICILLFDIVGFHRFNEQFGSPFGDKLLKTLAHVLRENYPGEEALFRWGADEFLVIAEGALSRGLDHAIAIADSFSEKRYTAAESRMKESVRVRVACGGAEYLRGESAEDLYRRARECLDQRGGLR